MSQLKMKLANIRAVIQQHHVVHDTETPFDNSWDFIQSTWGLGNYEYSINNYDDFALISMTPFSKIRQTLLLES